MTHVFELFYIDIYMYIKYTYIYNNIYIYKDTKTAQLNPCYVSAHSNNMQLWKHNKTQQNALKQTEISCGRNQGFKLSGWMNACQNL